MPLVSYLIDLPANQKPTVVWEWSLIFVSDRLQRLQHKGNKALIVCKFYSMNKSEAPVTQSSSTHSCLHQNLGPKTTDAPYPTFWHHWQSMQ